MTGDSDSSAYSVEWERMEYIRTHRLPVGYLDDCTSEQLQGLDDELREGKKAARLYRRRRRREIRELRERRREPPPEPPVMFKEPPPEPPVMFTAPFKEPPPQAPNKAPPPEAPAMLNAPPPEAPAMYKAPPQEVLAKFKAAPPVVPAMIKAAPPVVPAVPPEALAKSQALAMIKAYKARSRTAVLLWPKNVPTKPKVEQIRRFKEHSLNREPPPKPKPVAKPKPMPEAEPTGRSPGDPYYATDGVPWLQCTICYVFPTRRTHLSFILYNHVRPRVYVW